MNEKTVGYYRDRITRVVIRFDTPWDIKSMEGNLDYEEVTEKEYDKYLNPNTKDK